MNGAARRHCRIPFASARTMRANQSRDARTIGNAKRPNARDARRANGREAESTRPLSFRPFGRPRRFRGTFNRLTAPDRAKRAMSAGKRAG